MATGISLFNPDIFTDDDFASAFITGSSNSHKDVQEINMALNKQSLLNRAALILTVGLTVLITSAV
jgi:hypothetical protein